MPGLKTLRDPRTGQIWIVLGRLRADVTTDHPDPEVGEMTLREGEILIIDLNTLGDYGGPFLDAVRSLGSGWQEL